MTDRHSLKQRSYNMSKVKSKNTKPEMLVRKELHKQGIKYRIHYTLSGKPDIVIPKLKKVIFVNGCFWHQHNCPKAKLPERNRKFWKEKLARNAQRDIGNYRKLKSEGWDVFVAWECELGEEFDKLISSLIQWIKY